MGGGEGDHGGGREADRQHTCHRAAQWRTGNRARASVAGRCIACRAYDVGTSWAIGNWRRAQGGVAELNGNGSRGVGKAARNYEFGSRLAVTTNSRPGPRRPTPLVAFNSLDNPKMGDRPSPRQARS